VVAESEDAIKLYNRMAGLVVAKVRPRFLPYTDPKVSQQALELCMLVTNLHATLGAYVASCFARRNWTYCPEFKKLCDKGYIEFFQENRNEASLWWRQAEMERESQEPVLVPVGRELVKRRLLATGGPSFCMAQPLLSGGHNRHSPVCQACPVKKECAGE
jgi:hypothetical protein